MLKSLDRLTLMERLFHESWLKCPLAPAEAEKLLKRDSCLLSDLVCCAFDRNSHCFLDSPFKIADFTLIAVALANELDLDSVIVSELIDRMVRVFTRAKDAIFAKKLKACDEPIHESGKQFVRYWVNPKEFFIWLHQNEIFKTNHTESLVRHYILKENRGRRKDSKDETLIKLLIDLLSKQSNRELISARELCELPQAKILIKTHYKDVPKGKIKGKVERLVKKIRICPEFNGYKRSPQKAKKNV